MVEGIGFLIGFFLYDLVIGRGMSKWRVNVIAAMIIAFVAMAWSPSLLWMVLTGGIALVIAESNVKSEQDRQAKEARGQRTF